MIQQSKRACTSHERGAAPRSSSLYGGQSVGIPAHGHVEPEGRVRTSLTAPIFAHWLMMKLDIIADYESALSGPNPDEPILSRLVGATA